MAQKIVAFVARSFDPNDEAKINPITKFLESFNKLGFIVQDAEQSDVESVSEKVRSFIDQSDVFVGIFTKKHPIFRFQSRWATAIRALKGSLVPSTWSAPPWVLQESGYALKSKGKKALILFREHDVEIPGLQGDLEYIPYDPKNPLPAIQHASEMINSFIAKAENIRVETTVQSQPPEVKKPEAIESPPPSDQETRSDQNGTHEETKLIFDMLNALRSRNWEVARQKYEARLKWIREHEPEGEINWKSLYQWARFSEGKPEALDELRDLAAKNEGEYEPLEYIAMCLEDLHEYDQAVDYYLRAASVAKPNARAQLEIKMAAVLRRANKLPQARQALLKLRDSEYATEPRTQFLILKEIYSLFKQSEDSFRTFAIGELALHQGPEETSFRFSLAYDYEEASQSHLSLYHYKILCDHDDKDAASVNNLAVASENNGLPVLAVRRYKQAYELGNTLGASNLANKYLKEGFSGDAITLLRDAQTKENCKPDVPRTLALVHERVEQNSREQEKVLAKAEEQRNFLLSFAEGLLSPCPTNLAGRWVFPVVALDLNANGSLLEGFEEKRTESHDRVALFPPVGSPKPITKIEKSEFSGRLLGRTCKFKLETSRTEEPPYLTLLGGPSSSTVEGYILFAEDGLSGQVAEVKDGKPHKYYNVLKST